MNYGLDRIKDFNPFSHDGEIGYKNLSKPEMVKLYKEAQKLANQRITRLTQGADIADFSQALRTRTNENGDIEKFKFNKDMSLQDLQKGFKEMQNFLNMKSSTRMGTYNAISKWESAGFTKEILQSDEFKEFEKLYAKRDKTMDELWRRRAYASERVELFEAYRNAIDKGITAEWKLLDELRDATIRMMGARKA